MPPHRPTLSFLRILLLSIPCKALATWPRSCLAALYELVLCVHPVKASRRPRVTVFETHPQRTSRSSGFLHCELATTGNSFPIIPGPRYKSIGHNELYLTQRHEDTEVRTTRRPKFFVASCLRVGLFSLRPWQRRGIRCCGRIGFCRQVPRAPPHAAQGAMTTSLSPARCFTEPALSQAEWVQHDNLPTSCGRAADGVRESIGAFVIGQRSSGQGGGRIRKGPAPSIGTGPG